MKHRGPQRREPARTVFIGSGTFAVPILDALMESPEVRVVGVVTAPDRPSGRKGEPTPTPVARRARELGLLLLQPNHIRDPDSIAAIAAMKPDLGVLADYGQIVPRAILEVPTHGILNVHPSLLPRHRGATPIPATIAAGDLSSGVTVIRMDEGLDTGPIVSQQGWVLNGTERAPELEAEAAKRGADLLKRTLAPWLTGDSVLFPQDGMPASLTRTFRREDGRLDPSRSASDLERMVRANEPWPGSFIETEDGRLLVTEVSVAPSEDDDVPGRIVRHGDRAALVTTDGRLVLDGVQLPGRRHTSGPDFLRGHGSIIGRAVLPGP